MNTNIHILMDGTISVEDASNLIEQAKNTSRAKLMPAIAYIRENREELEEMTINEVCDKLDEFGLKMERYQSM